MNMRDIANVAKVSLSTVSRVINNEPGVKPAIRARVQQVIAETGYRPNLLARELIKKKTNMIGIMLPVIHSYYTERINAIAAVCNAHNYVTLIAMTGHDQAQEIKNFYLFYEKQVDGIIYSAHKLSGEQKRIVEDINKRVPIVIVDQEMKELDIPCVIHDSYDGARQAMRHLLENGHAKIAFVGGPEEIDVNAEQRHQGYCDGLTERDIPLNEAYIHKGDFGIEPGYLGMANILAQAPEQPTAVFAANDELAIGAMKAITEKDFRIPEDISVIGYDGIYVADYLTPPLTTIHQDQYEVGVQAANLLIQCIQHQKLTVKKIVMHQTLIVRKSTRRIG